MRAARPWGAAPGGDHAVFHNGAAALSDVTRRGGVAYTYSPWMRDYESGYSLHSLGSFYKINQRNAILLGLRYFGYPEMDGTGEGASGIHPKEIGWLCIRGYKEFFCFRYFQILVFGYGQDRQ